MRQAKKANAPSAVAATVMAATAVNAVANVVIARNGQSAATMRMPPQRKHPHKLPTVVKATLPLLTAAPPKAQALTTANRFRLQPRLPHLQHLWLTLPCRCQHRPLRIPAKHLRPWWHRPLWLRPLFRHL